MVCRGIIPSKFLRGILKVWGVQHPQMVEGNSYSCAWKAPHHSQSKGQQTLMGMSEQAPPEQVPLAAHQRRALELQTAAAKLQEEASRLQREAMQLQAHPPLGPQ